jgi:hypothetical protein
MWKQCLGAVLLLVVAAAAKAQALPATRSSSTQAHRSANAHLTEPVRSVGVMTFTDADTLVVADWRAGKLHALQLPPAATGTAQAFNLKNISTPIARALHTRPEHLRFEDIAFRPGAELAYITLSVERGAAMPVPALVAIGASGQVTVVDLAKTRRTSVAITSPPAADKRIWRDVPEASYMVTDLVYYDKKLYVAGLSNARFASTLRVYDVPFTGTSTSTSVEMYHAVHNQLETRAPIRAMAVVTLDGAPTLVAAYTCTPLVTIPLKDVQDGAHITGKTIAELGWGSAPVDMVTFDVGQGPMVLLANSHKAADLMTVSEIAKAAAQPGLSTPIAWPAEPLRGLKSTYIPMAGIAHMSVQDTDFLAILRRNEASGAMELVSIRKGYFLRLSDFVNEYDFANFQYGPNDASRKVHQVLHNDEAYSGLTKGIAQ